MVEASSDIAWHGPAGYFKLRVAAIIRRHDCVLVSDIPRHPRSFLPGGKVAFGETTRVALERELREELGLSLVIGEPMLVTESTFDNHGPCHEICFYYPVEWPEGLDIDTVNKVAQDRHRFAWAPIDRLAERAFQPAALLDQLRNPDESLRHLAWTRE